jgi:TonB family protein
VNEPVDRVIQERQRLEAGFRGSVVFSVVGHLVLVGAAFAAQFIVPSEPPLLVADGFAVVLPRGGGGPPQPPAEAPPASTPPASTPPETAPPMPEAPKVLKPPKEEPRSKGLPELDSRKSSKKKPEPQPARVGKPEKASAASAASSATTQTPGLEFGPPGPGVPDGTDSGGDWYLAGVQQKIWILWNQQIKSGFSQPVAVVFTILADGSVTDVSVVQSSGATLLDLAAKRAVFSAAPFGPLPKDYGTNRKTIQALFKPTS